MNLDLTTGRIGKSLVTFSFPMILRNLLQQLYNVADTVIVGKTIGATALAAVGSSCTLMILLTSVILGLCMGSGAVFAQLYGARRNEDMKISIFNSFLFILIVSITINIVSYLMLDRFIRLLNIPAETVDDTREYLEIIFAGILFVSIYNFVASVLRSVGNTVIPLVFLAVSAIANIVLDIVFIVCFHMGTAGAALATVTAQTLSAVCIVIYFAIKVKYLCPEKHHMHYSSRLLHMIIHNSILTAVQQSIMNLGILMVQSLVNRFGFSASAAFAVAVKIDAFAYMPVQDFGNAFSTYIAQNYGAKKFDRIRTGSAIAVKMSSAFCLILSIIVWIFAKPLLLLFVNVQEIETIRIGVQYLHIVGAFYIGIGMLFLLYGLYRGLGKSQISIVLTIISLGIRVLLAYTLSAIPAIGMLGIWWAVPVGWALADIYGIWYFCAKKTQLLSLN